MRRYVRERKRELGLSGREVFVPQSYELGQEAQVDWFEAMAILGGEARKLQFFAMRSMGSGDAFHRAYPHSTQQALLEASINVRSRRAFHAMPSYARSAPTPRKQGPRWLLPAPLFITSLCRHSSAFRTPPSKTATAPANPDPNPIDSPASAAPAAHFKRLYRNCPTTAAPHRQSPLGAVTIES